MFTDPKGPGLPRLRQPDGSLRAALVPHIDYGRGGVTYAITQRLVSEGTFVRPGTELFRLVITRALKLRGAC